MLMAFFDGSALDVGFGGPFCTFVLRFLSTLYIFSLVTIFEGLELSRIIF